MAMVLFIAFTVVVGFHFGTGACPTHCKAGQTCAADDSGCPECEQAYYGRQCQHRMECRFTTMGVEYRGLRNTTESGRTCQRWDSQTPHKHIRSGEENYCRNPDGGNRPYCYTIDPNVRWGYCDVKMCSTQCLSPPLTGHYVDVINPPSDGFAVGFDVVIGCMTGYEALATVTLTCQSDRTWTQTPLPTCNRVQCPSPSLAENSQVSNPKPTYKYEDQSVIVCNSGYTLQGQSTLTCQADKTWSPSVPTCKINECPSPDPVLNSSLSGKKDKYVYKDSVTIVCDIGYILAGQDKIHCLANKTWSTTPTCEKVKCRHPSLANSKIIDSKPEYEYQESITIVCDVGYNLQGQNNLTCQADASWGNSVPVCSRVNCIDLKLSSNIVISSPKKQHYSYEDRISFQCEEGYKLSHDNELLCQSNKLWDKEEPFCFEICNGLSTPQWIGITVGISFASTLLAIFVTALIMSRYRPKNNKNTSLPDSAIKTMNEAFDYDSIDVNSKEYEHVYSLPG